MHEASSSTPSAPTRSEPTASSTEDRTIAAVHAPTAPSKKLIPEELTEEQTEELTEAFEHEPSDAEPLDSRERNFQRAKQFRQLKENFSNPTGME
eukprot:1361509-Pyramimonas_sp.AAC.1